MMEALRKAADNIGKKADVDIDVAATFNFDSIAIILQRVMCMLNDTSVIFSTLSKIKK